MARSSVIILSARKAIKSTSRTRSSPRSLSGLHALLSDPFYCGIILWNNEEYAGKHEPIITRGLFNEVQEKMKRIYKTGQIKKHDHIFKGLIKCGDCGCLITWETQKGHNYGHCKGFKPCQEKGYIREEEIEKEIVKSFEKKSAQRSAQRQKRLFSQHQGKFKQKS